MKYHKVLLISILAICSIAIVTTFFFYKKGLSWKGWPTYLSILALFVSIGSPLLAYLSYKRSTYNDLPSFNIVQNLWSKKPSYSLVNESSKKLFQPPHPTYFMLIPSKVYWIQKGESKPLSNLVLTPVSYTNVTEQLDTGTSIGTIEKSELPINFYGKKGTRDLISSANLKLNDDFSIKVVTFPFLAIASQITYRYWGNSNDNIERFITIPTGKFSINKNDLGNLEDYLKDNSDLEVHPQGKTSIYKTANNSVFNKCKQLSNSNKESSTGSSKNPDKKILFLGGKPGGYGFFLKKLNKVISDSSADPLN